MLFVKLLFISVTLTLYFWISFGANYLYKGLPAAPGQFPFMVSIRSLKVTHCGGGILNKLWIVTAEQCLDDDPRHITVTVGSIYLTTGGVTHKVDKIELCYNKTKVLTQFALLKLQTAIKFDNLTQPIKFRPKPLTEDLYPLLNIYSNNTILIGW